ncbi:hypothetical protein V2E39_11035 [Chryseobacterium arthrosphaerae]|uniref:Outer membrane lipoprotein carrier protein LolA n=1 Tax=Chryseobacterium arthrosphaerae TaxID=651561 RepID=A0A1B8ZU49_9FLAO|nr:hypothetical protein [Chryseobacterium arthrosphaerae]AYZ13548.1 hypothetical protein EGY05_17085 [Chryseobacterium arthrosphaerae]MDG4651084.1 hypothetical protein [Chryseobacterium arthrosphaerae]OCA75115.1 hypothetical protein BBI00_12555 [Chryseobacterium arthrosphaerae]RTZ49779.1 hypothetical protein EJ377_05835 [Chryseobacterium arthrosphaerae]UEQ78848.1 hypothetical protein J8N07_11275 [Chryseobacterium arthrosphaerae]
MKKIIIPFFCAVLFSVPAAAQKKGTASAKTEAVTAKITPKEVIDNYFKASGGKDKLDAVKSVVMDNTISVQGMEIKSTTKKLGNKFKSVQSLMGKEMIQLFDGEKGYFDQMGTKQEIPADKIAELKKGKPVDALAFDPSNFQTATVEKLDGKDYNVLTSDKGKFYFDTTTGLLYKTVAGEGSATIKSYMTVDGLQFASDVDAEGGGQKMNIKTTKVVINSGVTDADFK